MDEITLDDDLDLEILEVIPAPEKKVTSQQTVIKKNPIEENLLKQLESIKNTISTTKDNIESLNETANSVLKKFSLQSAYEERVSSDSESEVSLN